MLIHYMKVSRVLFNLIKTILLKEPAYLNMNQGRLKFQTACAFLSNPFCQRLRCFTVIMSERVLFAPTATECGYTLQIPDHSGAVVDVVATAGGTGVQGAFVDVAAFVAMVMRTFTQK